jgi:hypothetical protein
MNLLLAPRSGRDIAYGNWVRPARASVMRSAAFSSLADAIAAYLRQEVPGRSFLIAGHRGAGKTTLVREVAEQLIDDTLATLQKWLRDPLFAGNERAPQRPLLVKLHGPSLVETELPRPGGGEDAAPTKAGDEDPATSAKSAAHAALVQITIALYRALAEEVADAFATRARDLGQQNPSFDRHELAAFLRLELDRAPDLAQLRACWEELEALGCGVLWPFEVATKLAAADRPDQGLREIIAVATAAQAFQVCSGAVTYKGTRKDSASAERSSEASTGFDGKDIANRLLSLGIGGALGYAAVGSPIGAGVGLLSGLAVSAVAKQSRKQEQTIDYAFIVDRSIQTLERDLPLVINRVREAGLAPVFLIDELDKLPRSSKGSGAGRTVRDLINRLKHLTTDYGFFCFLTGRDYYDEVQHELDTKPYPEEHTYFSERLFISYRPEEFAAFITDTVKPDSQDKDSATALAVLSRRIVHDSRLNTIDFVRLFASGWTETPLGRIYTTASAELVTREVHLLPAAVQIVIEHVLGDGDIANRMMTDGSFRQMVIDLVYRPSRAWQRHASELDISAAAFAQDVLTRRGEKDPGRDNAWEALVDLIGEQDVLLLRRIDEELVRLLCGFGQLRDPGATSMYRAESFKLLRNIIDVGLTALLRREPQGEVCVFRFTPEAANRETQALEDRCSAILNGFDQLGVTLADLQPLDWPPTLTDSGVADALSVVKGGLASAVGTSGSLGQLDGFVNALDARAGLLGDVLTLSADVFRARAVEREPLRLGPIIGTFSRHMPSWQIPVAEDPADLSDATPFPAAAAPAAISLWADQLRQRAAASPASRTLDDRKLSARYRWAAVIEAFLTSPSRADSPRPCHFDDLVLNAAGLLPSRLLRADLGQMPPIEWSELALAGIAANWLSPDRSTTSIPPWITIAALRALGFGRSFLNGILALTSSASSPELIFAQVLAGKAGENGPGVLLYNGEESGERKEQVPCLVVDDTLVMKYEDEVTWLRDNGAFGAGIDGD